MELYEVCSFLYVLTVFSKMTAQPRCIKFKESAQTGSFYT